MNPTFILSLIYGHLFSKGADLAMAETEHHIDEKDFLGILERFDQRFIEDNDAEITLSKCDMQAVTGKRSCLISLAEKYISQNNADISRNVKQVFIDTASGEIFGHADWKKEKSSKVVEKYLGYFYDLVFMKEISGISIGYRALLNAYTDSQHDINLDLYQRILELEKAIREILNNEIGPVDFKLYYEEVERRFTEKKRGEYKKLVGEEPDVTSYIDAFITKEEEQIPAMSFLQKWFVKTEPGVILIHGEPGHGKTMLCNKASFDFYKGRFLKDKAKNVVAVSLNTGKNTRIIDNGEVKLENALVWGEAPKRSFSFEDCQGALLFLDGFDEFIDEAKRANIENIYSFLETVDRIASEHGIHIVVLSRTIAVSRELNELDRIFEYYKLSPVTDEQQNNWFDRHKEYDDYREAFNNLRNDKNMQRLLRVPFLFRLIVNSRFETVSSNIVELYNDLFVHLMHKRGVYSKNALETVSKGLMSLAFKIYCTDTNMAKMSWNTRWVFAFYVESVDGDRIGFFHRTFYQYFLAKYIYSGIIKITDDNVEGFIGSFAERELDGTVCQYLAMMLKKTDVSKIHPNIEKIISALVRTEAYINHSPRIKTGNAEQSRIRRSTNVYRNTLHIAAAVSYVIHIPFKGTLDIMIRTYDSNGIMLLSGENKRPDLSGADLSGANLIDACLSLANLSLADLSRADLSGADLSEADLSGAYLSFANLNLAFLRGANLSKANLRGVDLSGANLNNADLSGADLNLANLGFANLSGADLCKAKLIGADLRGVNLSKANLIEARLIKADLSRSNLSGANLSGANLNGAIIDIKYKDEIDQSIDGYSFIRWDSDESL